MKAYGLVMAGDIDLAGQQLQNLLLGDDTAELEYAAPGRVARIGNRLMLCVDYQVSGDNTTSPIWIPLLQERNVYIHDQSVASSEWIIDHNMNSARVFVQAWDSNNRAILVESIENVSSDRTIVTLNSDLTGHAVVMMGNLDGAQKPETRFDQIVSVPTSEITVNHNLGYFPVIRFITLDGFEILPQIQHASTNQAILTFPSDVAGTVICI